MKDFLKQYLCDKKVLILGFGREGQSTYNFLQKIGSYSQLAIADMKPVNIPLSDNVLVFFGEQYQDMLDEYDIVFKSPGVALNKQISEYKCCITSQIELFLK